MNGYGPAELALDLGVPRETCERLETHRRLLELWSRRINLIGPNELADYWRRHALDCGQLVALAPEARFWVDMGSGAGFPGLVVACLLADQPVRHSGAPRSGEPGTQGAGLGGSTTADESSAPTPLGSGFALRAPRNDGVLVTLVEANGKKAAFLREAIRETGAPARVLEGDIDAVAPTLEPQHVVTARAFAPLPRIAASAKPILDRGAIGLFPKGVDFRAEIAAAEDQGWVFRLETLPSRSDPGGTILKIEGVWRAGTSSAGG